MAEVLAEAAVGTPLRRLDLQDLFAIMSGNQDDVRAAHGICASTVVDAVLTGLSAT